jgi:hypothetical protein
MRDVLCSSGTETLTPFTDTSNELSAQRKHAKSRVSCHSRSPTTSVTFIRDAVFVQGRSRSISCLCETYLKVTCRPFHLILFICVQLFLFHILGYVWIIIYHFKVINVHYYK